MTEFNLYPVLPEVLLLCAASIILIADLFVSDENRHISYWLTQLTLLGCATVTLATWQPLPVHTFSNMVVDDWMSDVLKLATQHKVDMRTAAYMLAISRVATVHRLRGIYA